MMMKQALRLALLAAGVIGITSGAQAQGPVNGDAKAGALVYYEQGCYGCHGYSGYGRKDLNNTGSSILVAEEVFKAFLRGRGDVAPLLPATDMPNYPANSLNDAQVSDLYAYIRSMPQDTPETGSIETFQQILEAAERPYRAD